MSAKPQNTGIANSSMLYAAYAGLIQCEKQIESLDQKIREVAIAKQSVRTAIQNLRPLVVRPAPTYPEANYPEGVDPSGK